MERDYNGGTFAADGHYHCCISLFKKIKFKAPEPESNEERDPDQLQDEEIVLSRKQKVINHQIRAITARVESPFGIIKTKFDSLSKPFFEGKKQPNYLVTYEVDIYNFEL